MTQEEIYKTIRNEVTKDIYNYGDQIMAISAWIESEFEKKGKPSILYGIEVDRSGLPEENITIHHYFKEEPTWEEVLSVVEDHDIGYDDKYCDFDYYKVDIL